jgi:hypothetical protein
MECSICYTNINQDQLSTLSCNHYFHNTCVTNWINTQVRSSITPTCPICRSNTISDYIFDNNIDNDLPPLIPIYNIDDDLPPLIPIESSELIPTHNQIFELLNNNENLELDIINDINHFVVQKYLFLLNQLYICPNFEQTLILLRDTTYYENNYMDIFNQYNSYNQNYPEPELLDSERESMIFEKNKSKIALLHWWINKANTYNNDTEYPERYKCLKIAGIIACRYAIS